MTAPWGIVLVPTEAGGALLATTHIGDLSVVAACVYWDDDYRSWTEHWPGERCGVEALPLWWEGALVPEGWDRARRVYRATIRDDGGRPADDAPWDETPSAHQVVEYAGWMESWYHGSLCRVVILDLVDGRIVERGQ